MGKPSEHIASIVNDLKASPHKPRDVYTVVCRQVDVLKAVLAGQPSFGKQAENRKYAEDVASLVKKLLQKIEGAPEGTQRTLLAVGAHSYLPAMPRALEIAVSGTVERYKVHLLTALKDLRNGCAIILDPKNKKVFGDYHTVDRTKLFCAATGFELMVGLEAGKLTNGKTFRSITNSLYEIVAPKEAEAWRRDHEGDLDLRAPCQTVLSDWRKDPAYLQEHTEILKLAFAGMIAKKSGSSM